MSEGKELCVDFTPTLLDELAGDSKTFASMRQWRGKRRRVTLAPDAISVHISTARIRRSWKYISRIERNTGSIFIFYRENGQDVAIQIPENAFSSRDEVTAFFDLAFEYWKQWRAEWHDAGRCEDATRWDWRTLLRRWGEGLLPGNISEERMRSIINDSAISYRAGTLKDSLRILQPALKKNSRFSQPFTLAAAVTLEMGQFDESIKYSKSAIERDRDRPYAYLNRAAANLNLGKYDSAKEDVERALDIHPRLPLGLLHQATLALVQFDFVTAAAACEEISKLKPVEQDVYLWLVRVELHCIRREFEAALQLLDRAKGSYSEGWTSGPNAFADYCAMRARTLAELGHYKEALDEAESALKSAPTGDAANLSLADLHCRMNEPELALEILDMHPMSLFRSNQLETYRLEALVQCMLGNFAKAMSRAQRGLELEQHPDLQTVLALIHMNQDEPDVARSLLKSAVEKNPYASEAYWIPAELK